MNTPDIMTSAKFSAMIETHTKDGTRVMDAILDYCFKNNFEVESAAKLCNTALKKRLAVEADDLNMMKPPPPPDEDDD